MQIFINHKPRELPEGATLADAIQALQPQPPFAAAVNLQFVPRTAYGQQALNDGDRIEIIAPVTGG
ncbi:MAG: sulfur carrier protein ThiS [Methylibium sp.]|uniref:sulfur carrier protein ThiS n=1 Tax=Methylibium sp. TaxID=2067992 RepID=UPI0017A2F3C5|nr:sulfur carrier protein ThiS [Methylibium sp.]MBA2723418.1 sulfur carrier protein ThiS [Methylibium sp.]MBA3589542.1 sulfur carrier protein ThiS [Methylibium sp.]MBA3623459.1 sulfur carrier protein ThiS [Methylibium sp.]